MLRWDVVTSEGKLKVKRGIVPHRTLLYRMTLNIAAICAIPINLDAFSPWPSHIKMVISVQIKAAAAKLLQKPTTSQEESVSLQKSSLTDSSTQRTCYQFAIERWKAGSFRVIVWERESSWAQMDVLFKTFKKKKRKHGHKANGTAGIKQHRSNR